MNHRFSLERHVQIPGSVRGRGRCALAVPVKQEHSLVKIKFAARTGQATETESYGDGWHERVWIQFPHQPRSRRRSRVAWRGVSAVISHRYKCLYIKVPKCASTTVSDWFLRHGKGGRSKHTPWWYNSFPFGRIHGVTQAMNLYPDYVTFSFVRNPYDRFISIWLHACRQATAAQGRPCGEYTHSDDYGTLREFAELCGELLADIGPLWGRDVRDFFQANAEREYGPRKIRLKYLGHTAIHARRQTDFLPDCHPERLFGVKRINSDPLSFVGTVENIDADFSRLADMLGFPDPELPDCNASGIGGRVGNGERYATYYDAVTRRLVEEIYAADFAFTGCDFHNGHATVAVPASKFPMVAERPARRRRIGTLPARVWYRLRPLEIRIEKWILRSAMVRRLLRPIRKRLWPRLADLVEPRLAG